MAETAGKDSSITQASVTVSMQRWTVNDTIDAHDVTSFDDVGIAKWIAGIKRWAGTFGGSWDISNTLDVADLSTTATFLISTGKHISGTILVTSLTIAANVQGVVTMEYTYVGNGTPLYTIP